MANVSTTKMSSKGQVVIPDIIDGLVKSRKIDFLPQHVGIIQDNYAICCGQNKMLGLFTRPSLF